MLSEGSSSSSRRQSSAIHISLETLGRDNTAEDIQSEACSPSQMVTVGTRTNPPSLGDGEEEFPFPLVPFKDPFAKTQSLPTRKPVALRRGLLRQGSSPRPTSLFPRANLPAHIVVSSIFGTSDPAFLNFDSSADSSAAVTRRVSLAEPSHESHAPYCDIPQAKCLSGNISVGSTGGTDRPSVPELLPSKQQLQERMDDSTGKSLALVSDQSFPIDNNPSGSDNYSLVPESRGIKGAVAASLDGNGSQPCLERTDDLPQDLIRHLVRYLDRSSYLALKSSCRRWCRALRNSQAPRASLAPILPKEVLHQVFLLLSPQDFDRARHTCSNWISASLDRGLLLTMLQRGAWLSSLYPDHTPDKPRSEALQYLRKYDVWSLSCFIARECALSGTPSGCSLPEEPTDHITSRPFITTGRVDFKNLASGVAGKNNLQSGGLLFKASACGTFILAAEGSMIYVYALEGSTLRPLTSLICPRRVLSMAMDTSSHTLAVAALLDGRMGIVCDISFSKDEQGRVCRASRQNAHHGQAAANAISRCTVLSSDVPYTSAQPSFAQQLNSRAVQTFEANVEPSTTQSEDVFQTIDVQHNSERHQLEHTDRPDHHDRNWINQAWHFYLHSARTRAVDSEGTQGIGGSSPSNVGFEDGHSIPIETGGRKIYRYLCSDDDPPRSVAICPQRRCVAFGCSAGVELHWVDALTGQDLNRWFPLTASSDFLYFLPPRSGFDSAKKLRLISSTAHPVQASELCRKFSADRNWYFPLWRGFAPQAAVSVSFSDHYHAVPLSDGVHILFTDPTTGLLCLGTDAPLGGPVKLSRKVIFVPPTDCHSPFPSAVSTPFPNLRHSSPHPRVLVSRLYTATSELRFGARVVCVCNDEVMVYTVPPDTLAYSRSEHADTTQSGHSSDLESLDTARSKDGIPWLDWWCHDMVDDDSSSGPSTPPDSTSHSIWPLYVRGIRIGRLEDVIEIAVHEVPGGEFAVWAFSLNRTAVVWQLDLDQQQLHWIQRTVVGHDARIKHRFYEDEAGDAIMEDTSDAGTERDSPTIKPFKPSDESSLSLLDGGSSHASSPSRSCARGKPPGRPQTQCIPGALSIEQDDGLALLGAPAPNFGMYDAEGNLYISSTPF